MKSLRFLDRRVGSITASLGLLLGVVAPAAIPAFASADQLSTRSIQMSSSIKSDSNVTYGIQFHTSSSGAFESVVIDFCSNSPIIGDTCDAPDGMSTASAATTYTGLGTADVSTHSTGNHLVIDGDGTSVAADSDVDIEATGITNPNGSDLTNGTFYARIYTFATNTATAYNATHVDDGGVALAVTDGIGVTATVKESMTFCVAGGTNTTGDQSGGDLATAGPSADCGNYNGTNNSGGTGSTGVGDPNLVLGTGTPAILDATTTYTGFDWAQLSTNAASGAVVRLKNANSCGGLSKDGGTTCDIAAAGSTAKALTGLGLFGLHVATTGTDPAEFPALPSGVSAGSLAATSPYGDATNYAFAHETGVNDVSDTYGSEIFDSAGAPVINKNIKLTFGASASPLTPAGVYKANLSLIATGTF